MHPDKLRGVIMCVFFSLRVLTFIASLGVPNVPSASIVLVMTVLSAIGVPTEGAAFLFAMEWLL